MKTIKCRNCNQKFLKEYTINYNTLRYCLFCELKFAKHIENKDLIEKYINIIRGKALKMI